MDDIDFAQQRDMEDTARAARVRKPEGPEAVGYCLSCGPDRPLPAGHRWCDAECREDWELVGGQTAR